MLKITKISTKYFITTHNKIYFIFYDSSMFNFPVAVLAERPGITREIKSLTLNNFFS